MGRSPGRALVAAALFLLATFAPGPVVAETFHPTTVAQLISNIQTTNTNGQGNAIDLGGRVFFLLADQLTNGGRDLPVIPPDRGNSLRVIAPASRNWLPAIAHASGKTLTITNGTIASAGESPSLRLLEVAAGATLTLDHVTLINGSISAQPGGAVLNGGALNLANTTVIGSSGTAGGAIYNAGIIASIVNCTFSRNSATNGGAIYNAGTITLIANTTFTLNTATASGAGIYNTGSIGNLVSTVMAKNTAPVGPDFNAASGVLTSESFNLIGNNSGSGFLAGSPSLNSSYVGTAVSPIDPMLAPLASNGGSVLTHALLAGSIAIDHGSNPLALPFDERGNGFARTAGAATDIGAFEQQVPIAAIPSLDWRGLLALITLLGAVAVSLARRS